MIRIFNRYVPLKYCVLFLAEHVLLQGIGYFVTALYFGFDVSDIAAYPNLPEKVFFITIVTQISMIYNQLYTRIVPPVGLLLTRLFQSSAVAWGILFVMYFLLPDLQTGRIAFVLHLLLSPLFLALLRLRLANRLCGDDFRENVLVVGSGHLAKLIGHHLLTHHDPGFEVVGFIDPDPSRIGVPVVNPKVIGTPDQIPAIVRDRHIKKVIIALPERRGRLPLDPLLTCKVSGVDVIDGLSFYERLTGKIVLEGLNPGWLIFSEGFSRQQFVLIMKRMIDLTVASVGLVLTAPLMFLLAVMIKLDSRGAVLFRQQRVGEGRRVFTLFKLRSMHLNAETEGAPVWATYDDPRTTRVGRIIRKLRLDELPQLINVLKGEMSIVGPRPERPQFVSMLIEKMPYYNLRHSVKPGITGWAQIKYRYGASFEDAVEKMHHDLYYIKNLSLGLDLLILLETIRIVLLGKGAR